jgi:glutathione S-transferase
VNVLPTLWHLPTSHYSEKVRWALDHKGVSARRRAPLPGAHVAVARWLTKGKIDTLPVLELDSARIGGSSAIISVLEERFPRRPLYPDDPAATERATELVRFFDDELGPHIRLLLFHELAKDPPSLAQFAAASAPWPLSKLGRAGVPYARAVLALRYRSGSDEGAVLAKGKVRAAFSRLEDELGDRDYLIGDDFTVADLTAASLFYPLVRPPEGPLKQGVAHPAALDELRAPFWASRGFRWVEKIYADHRYSGLGSRFSGVSPGREPTPVTRGPK